MKKTSLIISILSFSLLFSCGNNVKNDDPIVDDNDDKNNDDQYDFNDLNNITKEEAYEVIKELKNAFSYKVQYFKNKKLISTYLNEAYYHDGSSNSGYLLKESYDKSLGDSLLYEYEIIDNKVEVYHPLTQIINYQSVPITNLDLFKYFNYLNTDFKNKVDISDFIYKNNGVLYTTNEYLISIFAYTMNESEVISKAKEVKFYKDKDNNLVYKIIYKINNSNRDLETSYCRIKDINKAKYNLVSEYSKKNYLLSKTRLDKSNLINLDLSNINSYSLSNECYVYIDNTNKGIYAKSDLDVSLDKIRLIHTDPTNNKTSSNLVINKDNRPYSRGYGSDGTIKDNPYNDAYTWDNTFPSLYDLLLKEANAFSLEDDKLVYYGFNYLKYFNITTYFNTGSNIAKFYITLKDNKIDSFNFIYPKQNYNDTNENFDFIFKVKSSVINSRKITDLPPIKETEMNKDLDIYLNKINGNQDFKMTSINKSTPSNSYEIIKTNNIYLKRTNTLRMSGEITSFYEGYKKTSNGLNRFLITEDNVIKPNGYTKTNLTLESLIPSGINKKLFNSLDGTNYYLTDYVLPTIYDSICLGKKGKYLTSNSFNMVIDKNTKQIKEISYDYVDDYYNKGSEIITYTYDDIKIDDKILNLINNLGEFKEITSWEEEDPIIANKLKTLYGEEASNVPYVFNEETYKKWDSILLYDDLNISNSTDEDVSNEFYNEYRKALINKGFKRIEDNNYPGGEIYCLGSIKVRLAKVLYGGLYFYK